MDKIYNKENSYIQYDQDIFDQLPVSLFDYDYIANKGLIKSEAQGRGKTIEFEYQKKRYFLKNYIRGGLPSKLIYNKYWFSTIASTRAVLEYNFLLNLLKFNLPVPKPVALQIIREKFFYKANIITCKIENEGTLYEFIKSKKMNKKLWSNLYKTLNNFYLQNVYHSDLNSKNIIIDKKNNIYLIDFDKSYFFQNKKLFFKSLKRLDRSLKKIKIYNNEFSEFIEKFYTN
tara:strand:+ start:5318 stop:6007 length:690 start_codon:yes stop_codon:yes gene_type:complete